MSRISFRAEDTPPHLIAALGEALADDKLAYHIAQLRHAYSHLMAERVKNQRAFAEGLIAPAIEYLERLSEPTSK
jgi:hypothetical protein